MPSAPDDREPEADEQASPAFQTPWTDPNRDYRPAAMPIEKTGVLGEAELGVFTAARWLDRLQSRIPLVAFGYAVFKKYSDDEGGRLAAMLAYYTFLSIFPLIIGGIAGLTLLLQDNAAMVARLVNSLVPVDYRGQVYGAYEALPDGGTALLVALIGLLVAGTGGVFALYAAFNQIFAIPYRFRFGFGPRYVRVVLLLALLGVGCLIVAITSLLVGGLTSVAILGRIALAVVGAAVAFGLLYVSGVVLCRRQLEPGELTLGAALGGISGTAIVSLGGFLVTRMIANATPIYGAFGTVVGLISVLFLVSNAVVFSMEISVVRAWRLWPRCTDIHVLFPADERALAILTLMDERMPSQRNGVQFDATGHDDPRRPSFDSLTQRHPGIPRTRYDVADPEAPFGTRR